jgi:hypothetical protein
MVVHRKPKTEQDAATDAKRAVELYRYIQVLVSSLLRSEQNHLIHKS